MSAFEGEDRDLSKPEEGVEPDSTETDVDPDEGDESDDGDDGTGTDGDGSADAGDIESVRQQRDEAFARAKKAERKLARMKEKAKGAPSDASKRPRESDIEEYVDLAVAGYSKAEIAEVRAYARTKGISISDAARQPFVKAGIEAMRQKAKAAAATPAPSTRPSPEAKSKKDDKGFGLDRKERREKFYAALDRKSGTQGRS